MRYKQVNLGPFVIVMLCIILTQGIFYLYLWLREKRRETRLRKLVEDWHHA